MWKQQWALHARPLIVEGHEIPMVPGPGFGDLSHPTTRLVLKMMTPHVPGRTVLDVGCGSGVLSLAAHHLGATKVIGVDIDPDAVLHAKKNAKLNRFDKIFFGPPESSDILLLNMIRSEQTVAWNSISYLKFNKIFTSGIRIEDRENYLSLVKDWNWVLVCELQEDDWISFYFIQK